MKKQQLKSLHTKNDLKAAAELFAANGYADTSIQDIVHKSGYSIGAFYGHFASKQELATALWMDTMLAEIEETSHPELQFADRERFIDYLVEHAQMIRGNALIGAGCVVGNSTELKNVILFDDVQVPHYNYVGDSILGYKAHMGAGAITSNVKSDKQPVVIHGREGDIPTGIKKVGAMLGDHAEIGCGSVLNPGTIIGKNASVYPLSSVRGEVPKDHIFKDKDHIIPRK